MARKVAIFWDYASCPAPNNISGHTLAARLRREGKVHGNVTLFKAYFNLPGHDMIMPASVLPHDLRSQLSTAGVSIADAPLAGLSILAADLLCFALDNVDNPHMIIIVSGNPGLVYALSVLEARNLNIGLIVPSGQRAEPLAAHGRVLHKWEQLAKDNFNAFMSGIKTLPKEEEPNDMNLNNKLLGSARGEDGGDGSWEPIDVDERESTTQPIIRAPTEAKAKPKWRGARFRTTATKTHPRTAALYETTRDDVPQPLASVLEATPLGYKYLFTTVHTLHMLETEPPYADLIRDQEAIRVKTWRRQLKQIFYHETIAKNPQAPTKLESLFSEIEQYDKMTRNYLAFSRIGKLMTQISQVYLQEFDYRNAYHDRAKALLVKWQEIADSSGA